MLPARRKSHRRSSRWRYLALLGVLIAAGAAWYARPPTAPARVRAGEPAPTGATNPRTMIDFSLVLRLPGQARLNRFLDELNHPGSPNYHRFIDATTFGQRFGVSRAVLDTATHATGARRHPGHRQLPPAHSTRRQGNRRHGRAAVRLASDELPRPRRTALPRSNRQRARTPRPPRGGDRRRRPERRHRRNR